MYDEDAQAGAGYLQQMQIEFILIVPDPTLKLHWNQSSKFPLELREPF